MRRGVAPVVLGIAGLAISALLLYLTVTPTGQAIAKSAINFVGDLVDLATKALTLLIQFVTISLSIMSISFSQINTITGLFLFIISLLGNFAIGYTVIVLIVWTAEKIKNIIKPT